MRTTDVCLPELSVNCFGFNRIKIRSLLAIAIAVGVINSGLAIAQDPANDAESKINGQLAKKLKQQVITPLLAGDKESFQSAFYKIISKVSQEDVEGIEAFGKENGISSLRLEFFKNFQDMVLSGHVTADFKPKRSALMYLAAGLADSTSQLTGQIAQHELFEAETVSEDWRESRMQFIKVADLKSRMAELEKMGMFLDKYLARYRTSRSPQKEIAEALDRFETSAASFSKLQKEVLEKEAVFRLQRFHRAAEKLLNPKDFEESLMAAMSFNEDADLLETFFKDAKDLDAQELKQPDLPDLIAKKIDEVGATKNPAIEKARLLSLGMEQWRLGRYGVGPQGNGHLKAQLLVGAGRGGKGGVIDHSLVVPESSASTGEFPSERAYQRRHLSTWELEDRQLRTQTQFTPGSPGFCGSGSRPSESLTIRRFDPQDDSFPLRIVGTKEYTLALASLDKLVASSSDDELEVYDKIIARFPEFVFFSGMAGGVQQPKPAAGANANKNGAGANPKQIAGNEFRKHSLAWAMALARVELNATRSMYISGFDWFAPDPQQTFGVLEYYHVVLDDAAVHLKEIEKDDKFKRAIKKSLKTASSDTLAYLRRLKMIDSMLVALENSGASTISKKASTFRKEVEALTLTLESQVARSTGASRR